MSAVPVGYKQTEVGVIPVDWVAEALGPHVQINSGESPSLFRFEGSGIPYFKVDQLNNDSKYLSATPYFFRKGKTVSQGSLIFPKRGASILLNKVRILASDSFMDTNLMTLTLDESLDNEYLYYTLTHIGLWKFADTTSIPQINNKHVKPLVVPIPPLPEQRAIAAALSGVDALLAKLDQFIAKKRDLKQAAMQQLLTGQIRLPGFSGKWEETTFGNVVRHHAGNSTLIKGKLHATDTAGVFPAYSASGQDVWCDHFEYEGEAIVVSAVGSRCGKAFHACGTWCAIANTHVVWPIPAKVEMRFLGFYINDEEFWLKSGSGQPFVLFKQTFARSLRLPRMEEQTAIATVLSAMDAELAALAARRDKTRALKQGMMQELLTGRIRLVSKLTTKINTGNHEHEL